MSTSAFEGNYLARDLEGRLRRSFDCLLPRGKCRRQAKTVEGDLTHAEVAEANTKLARVSRIREYRILPRDLSIESGELTPTMKVKRTVVEANFSDTIEDIYS